MKANDDSAMWAVLIIAEWRPGVGSIDRMTWLLACGVKASRQVLGGLMLSRITNRKSRSNPVNGFYEGSPREARPRSSSFLKSSSDGKTSLYLLANNCSFSCSTE
jgi:hypothetical protein